MKVVTNNRRLRERALTLIELLTAVFVILVPVLIGEAVAKHYTNGDGIIAGVISVIPCIGLVMLYYKWQWHELKSRRDELKQKYKDVYRVMILPSDKTVIKKPEGAEIKVGDYGWESIPLCDDGLIYLQGLDPKWRVVWYAGFRQDQIEKVTTKPQSQYDWNYTWVQHPPPCPFPVQERKTATMGFPPFRRLKQS